MPVTGVGKPPVSTSVSMCVWSGRGDHFACVNARWSHTLLSDLSFSNCCRKGKVETCPYTWYNNTLKTSFKICLSVTVVVISILVYLGFGGVQLGQITFVDLENYKRPFLFRTAKWVTKTNEVPIHKESKSTHWCGSSKKKPFSSLRQGKGEEMEIWCGEKNRYNRDQKPVKGTRNFTLKPEECVNVHTASLVERWLIHWLNLQ